MTALLLFAYVSTAIPLADPEDHKLRGLHRSNADHTDQSAVVDVGLRHRGEIASNKKGLFLLCTLQHAVLPQSGQEIADAASYTCPGGLIVRVEYNPLCAALNGFL